MTALTGVDRRRRRPGGRARSPTSGSSRSAPPARADISGATAATFTPGADQVGRRVRVVVSFTDDGRHAARARPPRGRARSRAVPGEPKLAPAGPRPGARAGGRRLPGRPRAKPAPRRRARGPPRSPLKVAALSIPRRRRPNAEAAHDRGQAPARDARGPHPRVPARRPRPPRGGRRSRLVATVHRGPQRRLAPVPAHRAQAAPPEARPLRHRGPRRPQPDDARAGVESAA